MGSGKLRKIMDDNIESLEGFIAHDLPNMVSAFVSPVVMLVLVFAVDWRFGLATFVGMIVSFIVYGVTLRTAIHCLAVNDREFLLPGHF